MLRFLVIAAFLSVCLIGAMSVPVMADLGDSSRFANNSGGNEPVPYGTFAKALQSVHAKASKDSYTGTKKKSSSLKSLSKTKNSKKITKAKKGYPSSSAKLKAKSTGKSQGIKKGSSSSKSSYGKGRTSTKVGARKNGGRGV